jgi:hypothetical protein
MLARLAEAEAYKDLAGDLRDCQGKTRVTHVPDPDAMESACSSLQGFLDTYPRGAHAGEVAEVQRTGRARAIRQRALAQFAAQQKVALAAQRREEAAAEAKERADREQYCNGRCLIWGAATTSTRVHASPDAFSSARTGRCSPIQRDSTGSDQADVHSHSVVGGFTAYRLVILR